MGQGQELTWVGYRGDEVGYRGYRGDGSGFLGCDPGTQGIVLGWIHSARGSLGLRQV